MTAVMLTAHTALAQRPCSFVELPAARTFACLQTNDIARSQPAGHGAPAKLRFQGSMQHLGTPLHIQRQTQRPQVLCRAKSGAALEPLTTPHAAADVDMELWAVLDLCSDDELEEVHSILFGAPLQHRPKVWL